MYTHNETLQYRADLEWLKKRSRGWWRSKKVKAQANAMLNEITMQRRRVKNFAIECSEWRWKVGGAAYSAKGSDFMGTVDSGIRNRVGHGFVPITDEDLKDWDL